LTAVTASPGHRALSDPEARTPWHAREITDVLDDLGASAGGLSASEAGARTSQWGLNRLPEPRRRSLFHIIAGQLASPFILLLGAAAVVSLAIGDLVDTIFIIAVVAINTIIGTTQEAGAEKNTAALRRSVATSSRVMRDSAIVRVDAVQLVPGDIVLVEAGDRVPADLRLLSSTEVQVDESSLTGESLPEDKDVDGVLPEETPLGDRINMAWAGTLVRTGHARGVVVATGLETEIGRIARALDEPAADPPLVRRLRDFTRSLGIATLVLVGLIVAAQLMASAPLGPTIMLAVALAISVVPEGLPVAVTVALSVATARMAKRGVIVRNLPAVEGLGACTVIATDKTGTLTINRLSARRIWLPDHGAVAVSTDGDFDTEAAGSDIHKLSLSATLANEATFGPLASAAVATGDTLDIALLVLAAQAKVEIEELRRLAPRIEDLPFSAERRFAASLNRHGNDYQVHVKGAPEVILPLCRGCEQSEILNEVERMAADGYRVLAIASRSLANSHPYDLSTELSGLTLLGLVGFIDPLRSEATDAVARCQEAGIAVKMITGDHPTTALAIARQLGLACSAADVVTGEHLRRAAGGSVDDRERIAGASVFARVEPAQKVQIVEMLKAGGHFVAMTGDGVNDAPALRQADIGVAMGKDGTDVARDAADLVITDDNFASIVAGVEEGRAAFDNIRKVVYLLVSTGLAEAVMFLLAVATGVPLPLTAVQLLWLNLVTNGGQDVALAFEKPSPDLLRRAPRSPTDPIFDRSLVIRTVTSGLYIGVVGYATFTWAVHQGLSESEARNLVLLLLVLFENVQALAARTETRSILEVPFHDNWPLVAAVAGTIALQAAAPFIPGLAQLLEVSAVSPAIWTALAIIAASLLLVNEWLRLVRRSTGFGRPQAG
jgi:Ca2+-transporting ATPase